MKADRQGMTLVEVVVASFVMLLVLGTVAFALNFFIQGSRRIEQRRSALIIANSAISSYNSENLPEAGVFLDTENIGGMEFRILKTVTAISPGIRELSVSVNSENNVGVELVRRFYELNNEF
ncbi:MAG: type II secretion system protein [Candidatus Aegiribacteria sp.]|nr:type II secretion system protein [Candidatus Aegiribacteria sp.]